MTDSSLPAVLLLYHSFKKGTGQTTAFCSIFTPMWLLFAVEEQGLLIIDADLVYEQTGDKLKAGRPLIVLVFCVGVAGRGEKKRVCVNIKGKTRGEV